MVRKRVAGLGVDNVGELCVAAARRGGAVRGKRGVRLVVVVGRVGGGFGGFAGVAVVGLAVDAAGAFAACGGDGRSAGCGGRRGESRGGVGGGGGGGDGRVVAAGSGVVEDVESDFAGGLEAVGLVGVVRFEVTIKDELKGLLVLRSSKRSRYCRVERRERKMTERKRPLVVGLLGWLESSLW